MHKRNYRVEVTIESESQWKAFSALCRGMQRCRFRSRLCATEWGPGAANDRMLKPSGHEGFRRSGDKAFSVLLLSACAGRVRYCQASP